MRDFGGDAARACSGGVADPLPMDPRADLGLGVSVPSQPASNCSSPVPAAR
jgi:hypothetical protein